MQEFIHRKNLDHYRKLLAGELDEAERKQIQRLLAEEEQALKALPPEEPRYKAR